MQSMFCLSLPRVPSPAEDLSPFPEEVFYRLLLEASPMAFFCYEVSADRLTLSLPLPERKRVSKQIDGFSAGLPDCPSVPDRLRQTLIDLLRLYCAAPLTGSQSLCLDLYGKGTFRWYLGFLSSHRESDSSVEHVFGYLRDVQAEKLCELRLENMRMYRRAVDFASLFVYEFHLPGYHPKSVGHRHENDFFALDAYLSPHREELIHPEDLSAFHCLTRADSLTNAFLAGQYELRAALRLANRKDQWVWTQFTIHLSQAGGGHKIRGIGYVQLIHSQKMLEERASLDAVTGLLNRATVEERIQAALRVSDQPCYFFIFDVDNFKAVNDTSGHAQGDAVLRSIADMLRSHTRSADLLGRIGGDEFVALLCGLPSQEAAQLRAEEILRAIRAIKSPAGSRGNGFYSLSIGMAASQPGQTRYAELFQAADTALYRAKALGKNQCCLAEN